MIEKIIEYSARNRVVVLAFFALVIAWGCLVGLQDPGGCHP